MESAPLVLAFGFGNALMLGWMAAAAAPIVIHLWNRRRYREVRWAAMEYLLAALRKNSRRIRLEQWLVLAVRVLLIALLVMAVAQPYMEQMGLNFIAGQRTLKVLVIDGSFSMGYKPTDKNLFERAKQLAEQIVEESSQGDAFMLLVMASPPSVVVGTPAMEQHDFIEEIKSLKLPHGGGDLPATLVKIEELLHAAEWTGKARTQVFFLTDLGRASWAPELAGKRATGEYEERIARLAQGASLVVIDLGQEAAENLAVTGLAVNEPYTTIAGEVAIEAQVRNFGAQLQSHHLIEFLVDGHRVKESYVNVPAGGQAQATINYRFEAPGNHVVEARLGPDLLDIDNHRWLALDVKESLRVLCVDGKPAGGGMVGATDYLVLALNPQPDSTQPALVRPEVIAESALLDRDLTRYDCIFLCNVAQFTASEARVLHNYVQGGGGVVFFLGDQVLAERYNGQLGGDQQLRLLPARLNDLSAQSQVPYRFDPLDYRHPLVSIFKGREQAGLLTTPTYRYFRLTIPEGSAAKTALAFEGGDPAIVEEPIGRGRSILVATEGSLSSVDPATKNPWTTMPVWPSYVPIVQELLALAVRGQSSGHNSQVGQEIGERMPTTAARLPITLHTPDGPQELRPAVDAEGTRWSYGETFRSGIYRAELGPPIEREESFAVNVDTSESNLAKIDRMELPAGFTTEARTNLDVVGEIVNRHSGLHKSLLYGVLGLLLLETFLAWRFGHAKA